MSKAEIAVSKFNDGFSKPEENEIIHSQGLTRILCPKFVNDAAEIIELIL